MILSASSLEETTDDQPSCTISQLLLFNSKKGRKADVSHRTHALDRELPVPVYIGMNIHSSTRDKTLVETLNTLGICISYQRILQIEHTLGTSVCKQAAMGGVVCPSRLRKNLFVVGAMDNVDHNPSSTTSQGSFHGTSISLVQCPQVDNPGNIRPLPSIDSSNRRDLSLPDAFSVVPAVQLDTKRVDVPKTINSMADVSGHVANARAEEYMWIEQSMKLLRSSELHQGQALSWSAYHASFQYPLQNPPAIIGLLPLFVEKADSPAMVKHTEESNTISKWRPNASFGM